MKRSNPGEGRNDLIKKMKRIWRAIQAFHFFRKHNAKVGSMVNVVERMVQEKKEEIEIKYLEDKSKQA